MHAGTAVARAVKEAGRGTHVALGCEDVHQAHSSRYTAEFCKPAEERAANGSAAERVCATLLLVCVHAIMLLLPITAAQCCSLCCSLCNCR